MILKKIDNTQTKPRLVSINPLHYLCTKQRKRKVEQDFLNSLNDQQREAVLYTDGPELVIAGAGSGKTRVLTYKIAHLLQMGYPPYRLLALTFTNKAANEMKERIAALVETETAQRLWAGTFHSIFSRILRANADRLGYRHDFTIYDSSDSLSLIKSIIREKMKIKLIIIDSFESEYTPEIKYFYNGDRLENWDYSPADCYKHISTRFCG